MTLRIAGYSLSEGLSTSAPFGAPVETTGPLFRLGLLRPSGPDFTLVLAPAIAERLVVLDLAELGIDGAELVANALDAGADVGSVAILTAPRDEADIVHAVVDGAVADIAADVGGQRMHDLELGHRQVEVGVVPEGATDRGLQQQAAAMEVAFAVGRHRLAGAVGDQTQAAGEDRHAARLVDEVDRAASRGRAARSWARCGLSGIPPAG